MCSCMILFALNMFTDGNGLQYILVWCYACVDSCGLHGEAKLPFSCGIASTFSYHNDAHGIVFYFLSCAIWLSIN